MLIINTEKDCDILERYPLVSIISTFKDSKIMLKHVTDSVLFQDYPNVEHCIIDSNSTDGSVDLLKEYESQFSEKGYTLKWKSESDKCIAEGANKAASMMSGDYFMFLTNPFVSSSSLSTLVKALVEDDLDAVSGGLLFHRDGIVIRRWRGNRWPWRLGWMAANETLCMKKELFEKNGPYCERHNASFDYDFQLSVFMDKTVKSRVLKTPIIFFYADGISNSNKFDTIKEDYASLKSHGVKFAWFTLLFKCFAAFLAYTFVRKKNIANLLPS